MKKIKSEYKTKRVVEGWLQAMSFADQDFYYALPVGTTVAVYQNARNEFYAVADVTLSILGKTRTLGFISKPYNK